MEQSGEIAARCGISQAAVRKRLKKALDLVRLPPAMLPDEVVSPPDRLAEVYVRLCELSIEVIDRPERYQSQAPAEAPKGEFSGHTLVHLGELVEAQEFSQQQRMLAQSRVDQPLAMLQAPGNLQFAVTIEQRHGAHLPKIHAYRILVLLVLAERSEFRARTAHD